MTLNWSVVSDWTLATLRIFIPIPRGGDGIGAPLNAFVIVRDRNSSEVSKLESDTETKSFIYSSNLKNYSARFGQKSLYYIAANGCPLHVKLRNFQHNLLKNYVVNE